MSLRYKILAAVIGVTVLFLAIALGVILRELINNKREFEQFDRGIRQRTIRGIQRNREEISKGDSPLIQHEFIQDIIHVQVKLDGDEIEIVKGARDFDEERVLSLIRRAVTTGEAVVEEDEVAVPDRLENAGGTEGATYFRLDIPNFSPHEPLQKVYVVLVLGVVAIILLIYVVLSRTVIRPIERLVRAANRVSKGDYSRPVPPAGREDELDLLVNTFNAMMVEVGSYRQNLEDRAAEAMRKAKEAEKNLVIAQRLGATGKLVSGIAHEINNPLGGMMNAARRLISGSLPSREKEVEYLELIGDGLQRIQETVKKVLQFTPHKVAPRAVEVGTVLNRALALGAHRIEKQGIDVVVDVPPDAQVFGDPFELQQVFLNILINAMDAVLEGGGEQQVTIQARIEGREIRVAFSDNGCGMTDEQISQAFDLFYTTKEVGEGTGLGLSIVHNVVDNHGGHIAIRSEPGEGTTVEIFLPVLEEGQ